MLKHLYVSLLSSFFFFFSLTLFAQNPNISDPRRCQEDAIVSVAFSGATSINTCTDDDVMDRIRFQVKPFRQAFAYVVVDADDIIQSIGFSNFINFDLLPPGALRVYAFSTYNWPSAVVGDNFTTATLATPCAGLTQNFVSVNNGRSGDIQITSAQEEYTVCVGDGETDPITVSSAAFNLQYLITDAAGNVLVINDSGELDFEGAGIGVCRVYALAGLSIEVGENVSILEGLGSCGEGLSENFITVNRVSVAGGSIATVDGATEIQTCPDGNADLVEFTASGGTGANNRLIVTDENNIIIGLPEGNTVDFDGAGVGVCRVWNLSYSGTFTGEIGDDAAATDLSDFCESLSDNFVTVVREVAVGGTIATADGTTEVEVCPGDGNADFVSVVSTGTAGGDLIYIVTDTNNVVLTAFEESSFDFDLGVLGICRIWTLVYQGNLTISLGDDTDDGNLSDGCFALSDNFVTVIRSIPAGGTVATAAGETEITICPGDGSPDLIDFVSTDAEGTNFTFVVTDAENNILAVPEGATVDFDGAGLGVCRLWGLSYAGELLAMEGDNAAEAQLASECFSLSDNFVTVTRELPSGGTVRLESGATITTVCPGDGIADVIRLVSEGATGEEFAFIVTDDNGIILSFPTGSSLDFDNAPPGTCRVYGLAYSGVITASQQDDINAVQLATSCAALSDNYVTVIRQTATTGTISTEDGETEILVCPGDAIPDAVRFDSTGTSLENFNYLITDTNNIVIEVAFTDRINFENFGEGVCRVWGLGYDGIITASLGDIAGQDALATECAVLSENFVTVTKELPVGGTVTTVDGATEVMVCSMDGVPDIVTVETTSASGARFVYIATTSENIILAIQDSPTFDFEQASFGTCRIWGLSFNGDLLAQPGDDAAAIALSSGCFSLSDNFVTVVREAAMGGTVSLANGETETVTCPGDGVADVLNFASEGTSGANYLYVITDTSNVILAVAADDSFDFDGAGEGTCRVWGLAFAGSLIATVGDTASLVDLATGCFDLSENFITVVREIPNAGNVSLEDGTNTIAFCSGDPMMDSLVFVNTSTTSSNYAYIIAQDSVALLAVQENSFDFSNAFTGTYTVYGVAYTGALAVVPGLDIFENDLSTGCFDLSATSIEVNVTRVDGGFILGNGSENVYLCPENADDGFVNFTTNSILSDTLFTYVITTNTDIILNVMDSASFDFGALPLEEVRVYAISYTGEFQAGPGSSLTASPLATGCVTLSDNFVSIFNDTPEAGEISLVGVPPSGISCSVDGEGDIAVATTSESLTGYAVLVTDTSNIVLLISEDLDNIPLGDLGAGDYRVWGLAFTGNITVTVGDDAAVVALADNCYELTTDFVPVTQGGSITAGTLTNLNAEGDTTTFCHTSGENPIAIVEASIGGPSYRYIVTDATGRVIAPNLPSNIIPFTAFGPGEYRIYGFNFTGTPTVAINQSIFGSLSNECFAVTSNFITVFNTIPDGGMVSTPEGETEVSLEIDDDGNAFASFVTTSDSLYNYVYVITDENNLVLGTSNDATINFGPAGPGVCRVWGLSYTGELTVMEGDDAANTALSDGCFSLSDDFVTVTRTDMDGVIAPDEEEESEDGDTVLLRAYPNPSAGSEIFLSLESILPLPRGQVSVRDLNGRSYDVQLVVGGTNSATVRLDISNLPAGMYFAQYQTELGMQSVRFMKR